MATKVTDISNITTVESVVNGLKTKVDIVAGKALSDNNFDNAAKTKLEGIAAGAQKNVKPNWSAEETADNGILNKPIIPIVNDRELRIDYSGEGLDTITLGRFSANSAEDKVIRVDTSGKVTRTTTKNQIYGTDSEGRQMTYDLAYFGSLDDVFVDGDSVVSLDSANNVVANISIKDKVNRSDIPAAVLKAGQVLRNTIQPGVTSCTSGVFDLNVDMLVEKAGIVNKLILQAYSTVQDSTGEVQLTIGAGNHRIGKNDGGDIAIETEIPGIKSLIRTPAGEVKLTAGTMERLLDKRSNWEGAISHEFYPSYKLVYDSLYGATGTPSKPVPGGMQPRNYSLDTAVTAFAGIQSVVKNDGSIFVPQNKAVYSQDGDMPIEIAKFAKGASGVSDVVYLGSQNKPTVLTGLSDQKGFGASDPATTPRVYIGFDPSVVEATSEDNRVITQRQIKNLISEAVKGTSKYIGTYTFFGQEQNVKNDPRAKTNGDTAIVYVTSGGAGWKSLRFQAGVWQDITPEFKGTINNGDWGHAKYGSDPEYLPRNSRITFYYNYPDGGSVQPSFDQVADDYSEPDQIDLTMNDAGKMTFRRKGTGPNNVGGKSVLNNTDADGILFENDGKNFNTIKDAIDTKVDTFKGQLQARKFLTVAANGNLSLDVYPALPEIPVNDGNYALKLIVDKGQRSFVWEKVTDFLPVVELN